MAPDMDAVQHTALNVHLRKHVERSGGNLALGWGWGEKQRAVEVRPGE